MVKILVIITVFVGIVFLTYAVNLPSQLTNIEKIGRSLLRTNTATSEAKIETSAVETGSIKNNLQTQNKKLPTPTPDWSVRKVDEHLTEFSVPISENMSTRDELFAAVNDYRKAHGLNTLTSNSTICDIAQKRAQEQVANGGLDNHAGFNKYGESQNEFIHLGEVLYGGQALSGVHIVEFGWDRSLTGHREALQNPSWQIGCGGIAGFYAAFVFANN